MHITVRELLMIYCSLFEHCRDFVWADQHFRQIYAVDCLLLCSTVCQGINRRLFSISLIKVLIKFSTHSLIIYRLHFHTTFFLFTVFTNISFINYNIMLNWYTVDVNDHFLLPFAIKNLCINHYSLFDFS